MRIKQSIKLRLEGIFIRKEQRKNKNTAMHNLTNTFIQSRSFKSKTTRENWVELPDVANQAIRNFGPIWIYGEASVNALT